MASMQLTKRQLASGSRSGKGGDSVRVGLSVGERLVMRMWP